LLLHDLLVTPFVPDRAVCALDISILLGMSAPLDASIKAPVYPLGGRRKVYLDAQPFAVAVILHDQQSKLATAADEWPPAPS